MAALIYKPEHIVDKQQGCNCDRNIGGGTIRINLLSSSDVDRATIQTSFI